MSVFKSVTDRAPRTAFYQTAERNDQRPDTDKHYKELDKVCPNNSFHPAGTGVDNADDPDHQNGHPAGPAGGSFKNLAGGQQYGTGVKHLTVSIAYGTNQTGISVITVRQIFKRCKGFDLEKESGKDYYRDHPDKWHDQT